MSTRARLEDIEADIAEDERLMTALRLTIAAKRSAGEDTASDDRRVLEMMQAWMLLQDQRQKVVEGDLADRSATRQGVNPLATLQPFFEFNQQTSKAIRLRVGCDRVESLQAFTEKFGRSVDGFSGHSFRVDFFHGSPGRG